MSSIIGWIGLCIFLGFSGLVAYSYGHKKGYRKGYGDYRDRFEGMKKRIEGAGK